MHNRDADDGKFALNTVKRWFGVIEPQTEPQQNGLEAIAEYLGYPSWVALTQDADYDRRKEKSEVDYICELFPDYRHLAQSITDYQDSAPNDPKLAALLQRQNTMKDAIVKLADLLTAPMHHPKARQSPTDENLYAEQAALLRAQTLQVHDKPLIKTHLKENAHAFYLKAKRCKDANKLSDAEKYYLAALCSQRNFNALRNLGALYFIQRKDKEAAPVFGEIITREKEIFAETTPPDNFFNGEHDKLRTFLDAQYYLGCIYFRNSYMKEGFETMKKLLKRYENVDTEDKQSDIAMIYNELGNAYFKQGKYKMAEKYYEKTIAIYKQTGSDKDVWEAFINIAYAYTDQKMFDAAEEKILSARAYFEEKSDRMLSASARFELGYLSFAKGDYEASIRYYKVALLGYEAFDKILPSVEAKRQAMSTLSNMRKAYRKLGDTKNEDYCYEKMVKYADEKSTAHLYSEEFIRFLKSPSRGIQTE
ncbi:hypothetical protein AGMMS49965_15170 [Bacteroidia bacterium]|nr:hypothetical protein AGMMS49965_15170 [Bacteroidia bacterium]